MEKKFKLKPPIMPNFARFEEPEDTTGWWKMENGVPIESFTKQEAEEYGELMKQTFIKHWENKQKNK